MMIDECIANYTELGGAREDLGELFVRYNRDAPVNPPPAEHLVAVLQCAITEIERHICGDSPSVDEDPHQQMCDECAPREPQKANMRLCVSAVQLLALLSHYADAIKQYHDRQQVVAVAIAQAQKQLQRFDFCIDA